MAEPPSRASAFSLTDTPGNLPTPATPLIGREREAAGARQRLLREDVRLLTLTGPGGTGKTRLALQVAQGVADRFPGGVYFVPLAPIRDPALVVGAIAHALGVRDLGGRPLLEGLKELGRDRRLLLVLDNLEHLLNAAPLVADLLATCPGVKALVTSRSVLNVYGEHDFWVPPLMLPDRSPSLSAESLMQSEAVRLFVERAQAVQADFVLTEENAAAVAEICHRLDGLPLAIELAAARVRLLRPAALLPRLERRLPLLTGGARDLPLRQQTLRGTIAWSHDLLDDGERRLFRRLAVFVGGCSLTAVSAVCGTDDDPEIDPSAGSGQAVLEGVASLLSKSLLQRTGHGDGEPRLEMLETIREYALERLEASDESVGLRRRHAAYYLALAEEAAPKLTGAEQREWLAHLEIEHDNLRAALTWSLAEAPALPPGDPPTEQPVDLGLRLAGALTRFWDMRGHLPEGTRWLQAALAASRVTRSLARARALAGVGMLLREQGDRRRATACIEESLAIGRDLEDPRVVAWSLRELGFLALEDQGDHDRAVGLCEESLAVARQLGDPWEIAYALEFLGMAVHGKGDHDRAAILHEESLDLYRQVGDMVGVGWSLYEQGAIARDRGEYERASILFAQSLALSRELGNTAMSAYSLQLLGIVANLRGDRALAKASLEESLTLAQQVGLSRGVAPALYALGSVAWSGGDSTRAARLFGVAEAQRDAFGLAWFPTLRASFERDVATLRSELGQEAFAAAWAEGRVMSLDQAIAHALAAPPAASPDPTSAGRHAPDPERRRLPGGLTRREAEVLRLVASGRTNREIATALVLSEHTVGRHLDNICATLDVSSRAAATAFALREGIA